MSNKILRNAGGKIAFQAQTVGGTLRREILRGPLVFPLNVTVNKASGQDDPSSESPIRFTIVFSSSVADFVATDVTVTSSAGTVTKSLSGSGTTYTLSVSGMSATGSVTASVAAGVAHNSIGTANNASTSTDNTVSYVLPSWHTVSTSSQTAGGSYYVESPYTRETIDQSPASNYSSARSAAMSVFSPGGSYTGDCYADVGGSMGRPGAPRANCAIQGSLRYGVPAHTCTNARIACSTTCRVGVFASYPSGSQMLSASTRSPSGGYISLADLVGTINACANAGVPVYVTTAIQPPSSINPSLSHPSYTNTGDEAETVYGFLLNPGETLYWATGGDTVAVATSSVTALQIFY